MNLIEYIDFCKCGCGEEVKEGNLYVHGHNRRGLASYTHGDRWSMKHDKMCGVWNYEKETCR